MTPVRRRFGAPRPREPFDWPLFFRTLPWQPVPLWLVLSALGRPLGAAAPDLLGASCRGNARAYLAVLSGIAYQAAVPPVAAAAVYLLAGRRRLTDRRHRRIADGTLLLLAVVSVWQAASIAAMAARISGPLGGLKALCWPPRP